MKRIDPELDRDLQRFVDRAAAQIAVPARRAQVARRFALPRLLGSAGLAILVIAAALGLGRALNEARRVPATQPATTPPATSARPSREPADLAELPNERAVLAAFNAGGVVVQLIGGSKDESDLGTPLPARAFIVTAGRAGADVLFLAGRSPTARGLAPIGVCGRPGSASGRSTYDVYVGAQRTTTIDAGQDVYFLVSAEYFAITYDAGTRDALTRGLGLVPVDCTEPIGFDIKPVASAQTSGTGRAGINGNGDLVLDVSVTGPTDEITRPGPTPANLIWHLLEGTCSAWRASEAGHRVLARWTIDPQQPDAVTFRYTISRADLDVMSRPHAVAAFQNGGGGPLYACGDLPPL